MYLNGIDWIHDRMFLETASARHVLPHFPVPGVQVGVYVPQCQRKRPRPCSGSGRSWVAGTHSWGEEEESSQYISLFFSLHADKHDVLDILIILDGLGSGLGHLGHSLRACAEGFWLKRQGYDWEGRRESGREKRVSRRAQIRAGDTISRTEVSALSLSCLFLLGMNIYIFEVQSSRIVSNSFGIFVRLEA